MRHRGRHLRGRQVRRSRGGARSGAAEARKSREGAPETRAALGAAQVAAGRGCGRCAGVARVLRGSPGSAAPSQGLGMVKGCSPFASISLFIPRARGAARPPEIKPPAL